MPNTNRAQVSYVPIHTKHITDVLEQAIVLAV